MLLLCDEVLSASLPHNDRRLLPRKSIQRKASWRKRTRPVRRESRDLRGSRKESVFSVLSAWPKKELKKCSLISCSRLADSRSKTRSERRPAEKERGKMSIKSSTDEDDGEILTLRRGDSLLQFIDRFRRVGQLS